MPIDKKRYTVAAFAIAKAAIIEEKNISKSKHKAQRKRTKRMVPQAWWKMVIQQSYIWVALRERKALSKLSKDESWKL